MKTVFISGPMTGIPMYNYPAFCKAEEELRDRGFAVINTAHNFGQEITLDHNQYMRMCFHQLLCVDAIYQLDGWRHSEGATAENILAKSLGLEVID